MWSAVRLTKFQSLARPDHVWPEVWTKIGKAAQNREKQEWAKEKPNLHIARRPRAIHFVDPDDEEKKRNSHKCEEKTGETYGASHALYKNSNWYHESVCDVGECIRKDSQNALRLFVGNS